MVILITAIGSMSAESVISSLCEIKNVKIIGTDIYPKDWLPTSAMVDYFYQVPQVIDEKYISSIENICKTHKVNFIFPLTDTEVDVLIDYKMRFQKFNTIVCLSEKVMVETSRNKLLLSKFFKNSRLIKTIPTYTYNQLNEKIFNQRAIAKPINGRSSEGIKILDSWNETRNLNFENYIFQPYIPGEIYTVDYVRDSKGCDFSISRKELLRTKNGAGLTVEIYPNIILSKMVSEIGKKLNILGCINVEFLFDGDVFLLMDINPRFSAGVAFSRLCGYDFTLNHLRCFLNKPIQPPIDIKKRIFAKKFTEVVI